MTGILARAARRARGRLAMSLGQAAATTPLSSDFGFSRGLPVDRWYIESFLSTHQADVRGRVLEVGDDSYSRKFGQGRVERQDVVHVRAGGPRVTIVGDVTDPELLPAAAFDCIIFTQTLHLIFDLAGAVSNLHRALRPGGVALITVPGITPIDRGEWGGSWYWSLTELALARLLCGPFQSRALEVSTFGNLFAATAFLHGAAVQDLDEAKLRPLDLAYPVTVTARAVA